jgi:hypothetical protein
MNFEQLHADYIAVHRATVKETKKLVDTGATAEELFFNLRELFEAQKIPPERARDMYIILMIELAIKGVDI